MDKTQEKWTKHLTNGQTNRQNIGKVDKRLYKWKNTGTIDKTLAKWTKHWPSIQKTGQMLKKTLAKHLKKHWPNI